MRLRSYNLVFFTILVGALSSFAASSNAQVSATRYEVVDIGALTGKPFSHGLAVSDSGFVAGVASDGMFQQGFIWHQDTGLQWLDHPSGAGQSHATEVNDAGQVIGSASDPNGGGVLWNADGSVSNVFQSAAVEGLNNAGLVTGYRNALGSQSAYIWDSSYTDIGFPAPATSSQGFDINDVNQVAGTPNGGVAIGAYAAAPAAFLWSAASGFTTITTSPGYGYIQVQDLSNSGTMVGIGNWLIPNHPGLDILNSAAWKWDALSGFSPLSSLPSATVERANAVNETGIVVGSSDLFGTIWDEHGNIYKTDDLLAPGFTGWRIISVRGINNEGWLTGEGRPPGSANSVAVLLRPIPEPAAGGLMLLSGVSLLPRRRRA